MSAPSLSVQVNGGPGVTGDQLNTYMQTCDTAAQLRAFTGVSGVQVYIRGITAIDDGGQGSFYWNAGATNPVDNNNTVIVPTGSTQGCWTRLTVASTAIIPTVISGTNALSLAPFPGAPPVTAYANYQIFTGVTAAASTGLLTAQYGSLAALPVYLPSGVQAGSGTLSSGEFIMLAYNSALNAGGGGFAIVSGLSSSASVAATIAVPQGRLTLISNTPVMAADETAQSTIYYTPYAGSLVPIYNGTSFSNYSFSQLSLALDSNSGHTGYQASGSLFDLFVFLNGSNLVLCTGPAWSSSSARSSGTSIQLLNGIWTNTNILTAKIDTTSSTLSVPANEATYVGTMYATANGQTGMQFKPAAASGGSNNILGLYNAYNRVRTLSSEKDSTSSWSYTSSTWRPTDNSSSNRITFVDGLQQSNIDTQLIAFIGASTGGAGSVGMVIDATSGTPTTNCSFNPVSITAYNSQSCVDNFYPVLGLHYIQSMESGSTGVAFSGGSFYELRISIDM